MRRSTVQENPGEGLWIAAIFGLLATGGVIYVATRKSSSTSTPSPAATAAQVSSSAPLSPCQKAAELAILRVRSPMQDPSILGNPYAYWADLCRKSGGTPVPFPTITQPSNGTYQVNIDPAGQNVFYLLPSGAQGWLAAEYQTTTGIQVISVPSDNTKVLSASVQPGGVLTMSWADSRNVPQAAVITFVGVRSS